MIVVIYYFFCRLYINNNYNFQILNLNFGDWELFKLLVLSLREVESGMPPNISITRGIFFNINQSLMIEYKIN